MNIFEAWTSVEGANKVLAPPLNLIKKFTNFDKNTFLYRYAKMGYYVYQNILLRVD